MARPRLPLNAYLAGIRSGSRTVLAQAITLAESELEEDRKLATALLARLREQSGEGSPTLRIGITGPPGAGKSTLIEALGLHIVSQGKRLAVLAIDPSSSRGGGSILGDKTRMEELIRQEQAYVRPAPAAGHLGGTYPAIREAIALCEAAGYGTVLIETVGVGQSEMEIADLADLVILVLPPAGGDELQGVKRGIVEIADLLVINKADGPLLAAAREARSQYGLAMHLFPPREHGLRVSVELISAHTGDGISQLWDALEELANAMTQSGYQAENRRRQAKAWLENELARRWKTALLTGGSRAKAYQQALAMLEAGNGWVPDLVEDILRN